MKRGVHQGQKGELPWGKGNSRASIWSGRPFLKRKEQSSVRPTPGAAKAPRAPIDRGEGLAALKEK